MSERNADFERFFAGENYQGNSEWDRLLASVQVPGTPDASWDRRAAWLLWTACRPIAGPPQAVRAPAAVFADLLPPAPVTAGLLPRLE